MPWRPPTAQEYRIAPLSSAQNTQNRMSCVLILHALHNSALSHKRRASVGAGSAAGIMVYAAEFPFPQRDQPLLLPVDMREWLPEDDLVFISARSRSWSPKR